MIRLVRSEMLKLRTTHIWWIMLLATVILSAVAIAANMADSHQKLHPVSEFAYDSNGNPIEGTGGELLTPSHDVVVSAAANMYTSGQRLGLLFILVFGVLIITNEFRHKTASVTFLAEPRRDRVIGAKLIIAISWGAIFCGVISLLAIPAGAIYLSVQGFGTQLDERTIIQTILLNALAYGIWAIFGLGLGTLLKNQIAGVVVSIVMYLGQVLVLGGLAALSAWLDQEWIVKLAYWLPSGASEIMTSPVAVDGQPVWWAGALALLAYGVIAGGIGTLVTVRRDIS